MCKFIGCSGPVANAAQIVITIIIIIMLMIHGHSVNRIKLQAAKLNTDPSRCALQMMALDGLFVHHT